MWLSSIKLFLQTSTNNTMSSLQWNAEFINIIHYTHPAMKCLQGKMSVARYHQHLFKTLRCSTTASADRET